MVGKGNISATIIADSISPDGVRITTFELEYPRFIHAEFMTHRLFSRNAASSRAIPVAKAIELVKEKTAMPIHWGKNQPGMSAKEECDTPLFNVGEVFEESGWNPCGREQAWNIARDNAIHVAERYADAGYHKQIVNRLIEPYTMIKVVCTATEYDNFFWLRNHPDAQPEIAELARVMWEAYQDSGVMKLLPGAWHVPYFRSGFWSSNMEESLEDALAVSSSCCAQVSYRKLDDSLEKAKDIFKRLVESKPVHASPFEHQATPMEFANIHLGVPLDRPDQNGVTHIDVEGNYWSGNFRGWIQHRQLIPDNACWDYVPEQ